MLDSGGTKKILFISPHVDDAVLGCGGTMARLSDAGHDIYHLCFSFSRKSIPRNFSEDTTEAECIESLESLGLSRDKMLFFDYETRCFDRFRQKILEDLYKFNKTVSPEVVFLPSTKDLHQDHSVICKEGVRAFKGCTIFGYEMPLNNMQFDLDTFVHLNEEHIEKKQSAWSLFVSQVQKRPMNYLLPLAQLRGEQSNGLYAEAFEVIRVIYKGC